MATSGFESSSGNYRLDIHTYINLKLSQLLNTHMPDWNILPTEEGLVADDASVSNALKQVFVADYILAGYPKDVFGLELHTLYDQIKAELILRHGNHPKVLAYTTLYPEIDIITAIQIVIVPTTHNECYDI